MFIQGAAIDRILGEIVHHKGMKSPIDYVLCVGHFLAKVCYHEIFSLRAALLFLSYRPSTFLSLLNLHYIRSYLYFRL